MKWLLNYADETKWAMKRLLSYSLIFSKKIWRPWGTKKKRMTFRQAHVYSKALADIVEITDILWEDR